MCSFQNDLRDKYFLFDLSNKQFRDISKGKGFITTAKLQN